MLAATKTVGRLGEIWTGFMKLKFGYVVIIINQYLNIIVIIYTYMHFLNIVHSQTLYTLTSSEFGLRNG